MIAVSLRYESYMQSLHDLWSGAVRRPGWLLCLVSCYLLATFVSVAMARQSNMQLVRAGR